METIQIRESAENYLETILVLQKRHGHVRSIDIANELSLSTPSVSVAMKNQRLNGLIEIDEDGIITLQEAGRVIAERIYERHTLLTQWLEQLGVRPEIAAEDACRMEHVISAETFAALKAHAAMQGRSAAEEGT